MSTPETLSKNAIRAALEFAKQHSAAPIEWTMPTPGAGDTHSPDFWIMIAGRLILVEAKADPSEGGRAARPGQEDFLRRWSEAGAITFVVRDEASFDVFKHWMASYLGIAIATTPWRSEVVKRRPVPPAIPRAKRSK